MPLRGQRGTRLGIAGEGTGTRHRQRELRLTAAPRSSKCKSTAAVGTAAINLTGNDVQPTSSRQLWRQRINGGGVLDYMSGGRQDTSFVDNPGDSLFENVESTARLE